MSEDEQEPSAVRSDGGPGVRPPGVQAGSGRSGADTDAGADEPGADPTGPRAGVVVAGSMTGGAVATGAYGRATDSSRTTGPTPQVPPNPPVPSSAPPLSAPPPAVPPGGVFIGGHLTGGAVATGPGGHALFDAERIDPRYRSLLAAVDLLRSHLPLLVQDPGNDELHSTLDQVRQDITTTGQVPRGRLQRLREQLATGSAALAALTSAVAVADAVRGLLT